MKLILLTFLGLLHLYGISAVSLLGQHPDAKFQEFQNSHVKRSESESGGRRSRFHVVDMGNDGPLPRGTWATAVIDDTHFLVFGGLIDNLTIEVNTFFDDLYMFEYLGNDHGKWIKLNPKGNDKPSVRALHGMGTVEDHQGKKYVCVFGGTVFNGFDFTPAADTFWCYKIGENIWKNFTKFGGPSPRSGPLVRAIGSTLYVTGGIQAGFETLNDLWEFSIISMKWTQLSPVTGPYQPPRHIPMGDFVQDRLKSERLMVYGGETLNLTNFEFGFAISTHEYDISQNKWDLITEGDPTPPLDDQTCLISAKDMKSATLFGGDQPGNVGCPLPENPSNAVWDYDVDQAKWTERSIVESTRPPPIKRHTCARLKNDMFIVGGWGVECANNTFLAQPFNMKVYRLDLL